MLIRPEAPPDYPAIAALHAYAFGNRAAEAAVVALRRQSPAYDPELSLVAISDDRIAGHVLLAPCSIRLLDQDVRAVNLAPIAVDPERQRQGIGCALITEAHTVARAKGHAVSFLLGHAGYYSRLGYIPDAYGSSFAEVAAVPHAGYAIHRRALDSGDFPALRALWRSEEAAVDFAIDPGADPLEWLSPNPAVQACVYTAAGEVVGYTRVHTAEPHSPRAFLARDERAALAIARMLAQDAPGAKLILPLHPYSRSARAFKAHCEPWEAGMAFGLAPSPLEDYLAQVQSGRRIPGRPVWPVCFDLA
ncbi:MAG TPA: N-acetyltransferase [Bryobacteraceae bacterium]|nr:N-acetyltransferase [Bryobacteraceae bacterium]